MVSAIYNEYYNHRKKLKRIVRAAGLIMLITIFFFVRDVAGNPEEGIGQLIILGIVFELCMIVLIILPLHLLRIKKYTNIVGKNLLFNIKEKGIDIYDNVENRTIEKSFKWSDFEYICKQCYTKHPMVRKKFYGLQFVINESKFHLSLAKRGRKPDYRQRDEELSNGFFIICDRKYFDIVQQLWSKQIR